MIVYTFADDAVKEYADISSSINEAYCKKHGYKWIKNSKNTLDKGTWDPHWEKVVMTRDILKKNNDKYIFWLDADAAFNQNDIKLTSFSKIYPNADILVCHDGLNKSDEKDNMKPYFVNTGAMMFKNTKWTKAFVNKWIDEAGVFKKNSPLQDQDKFVDMLKNDEMSCLSKGKVEVLPMNAFNSPYARTNGDNFVVHLMKKSTEERKKIFNRIKNKQISKEKKDLNPQEIFEIAYNTRTVSPEKKVAIVTMYDNPIKSYASYATAVMNMYAFKNNYEVIVIRDRLSDRAPQWDKVFAVWKVLEKKDHDYVFWLDSDATFNDFNKNLLEDIIKPNSANKNIIISDDSVNKSKSTLDKKPNSIFVNTGSFAIKNNEWSRNFLKTWWENPMGKEKERYHEQDVLMSLYDENKNNLKDNILVLKYDVINSAFNELPSKGKLKGGRNDTFIIHMMARGSDDRKKFFKNHYNKKIKEIKPYEFFYPDGFIKELSNEKEENDNFMFMILIGSFLLIILVAIIVFFYKKKQIPNSKKYGKKIKSKFNSV